MSYLVLARKWRPQTFADLVGQEHVAQTLCNAISQGRVAHAFLFTGARGVGKTTIARVLAKALNCLEATGPTATPCAKCAACTEIARGNDVDVHEIDGASNNSVDDVRRLQESLPYLPARDRFKVVIVDEVHMLSTGAFNALLKTLEEPPPHVKFVFATTEVHKVPITILSRCQRYDFKLIPTQKIRERIAFILGQEGIGFDNAALSLVAREAAGSMRDALSLLDQAIAGATGALEGSTVAKLLGVADRKVLYDIARAVLSGDAVTAVKTVDTVAREGYDLAHFARGLLHVLRDLVVARVVPEPAELLDLADEERTEVLALAQTADVQDLDRLFLAWSRTADEVARAREPRWALEMALVRLSHRPPLVPIDDLIARLVDLEKRLGAGGDTRGPGGGGGGGARPATGGGSSASSGASGARASASSAATPANTSVSSAGVRFSSNTAAAPTRASTAPASSAALAPAATPAWLANQSQRLSEAANAATATATSPTPAPAAKPLRAPADVLDVRGAAELLDVWEQVVAAMQGGPIGVMEHAVPLAMSATSVKLAYEPGSFYARKVSGSAEVLEALALAGEKIFGARPAVEITQGALPEDAPTIARRRDQRRAEARAEREAAAKEHPFVKLFVQHVGGDVVKVKLDDG